MMLGTFLPTPSTEEENAWVDAQINAFNWRGCNFQGTNLEIYLNYVIKDGDAVIAGINSCFYLEEILYVGVLFVSEPYRHQLIGTHLLEHLEREARAKGAKLAHLDTFDFQAKDFYIKHGYDVYGTLDDCPTGHKRYYMKKKLVHSS